MWAVAKGARDRVGLASREGRRSNFGCTEEGWNGGSGMWPFVCPHLRDDYENVVTKDMF